MQPAPFDEGTIVEQELSINWSTPCEGEVS